MNEGKVWMGDGCRIAWRIDGSRDAPVLMLSNSLGTDMHMWDAQIDRWSRQFCVLRYDQRGHGASEAPPGAYSLDRLGFDVVELLDALDIAAVDFCGLSLGGMVGQWLGIRAPARIGRLVLANTSGYMGPPKAWDERIEAVRRAGMASLADASIARWFTGRFASRADAQPAIDAISQMFEATDPAGYTGCCAAIRDMDMRRTATLIERPTLIIGGTLDPATPPSHSRALHDAIPRSRLLFLPAAHLANVECPEAFAVEVAEFLSCQGVEAGAA